MNVGSRRALGSRYELVEAIGSGAMGEVWRAWDSTDSVYRAAKLLRSEYTSDAEILTRFIQERSILLGLNHENIVRVSDLVVEGDQLAIVMELVEGPSLRGYLREQGTLRPAEAVEVTCAILDALVVAHRARALHRDIKPDNVLLSGHTPVGRADVKLTDFGIARLAQESTVQATGLLGTPAYMPPELFEHGTFSAASDVYAAGVTLYELLAGRTPFAGSGNAHTVGFRHLTSLPPELPVPKELWEVMSSMLAKDPSLRLTPADTAARLRELLPSLGDVQALSVQPEPAAWVKVADASAPSRVRVNEVPANEDVGATRVRGAQAVASEPLAREGDVRGFVDAPVEEGVTQLRVAQPERPQAPVLESQLKQHRTSRRPLVLGILGGVGAVALVLVLVLSGVFSSAGSSSPSTTASDTSVTSPPQTWEIGINQTNQAQYNPRTHSVDLKVTYTALQSFSLTGAMLVDLHGVGAQGETTGCAQGVTWDDNAGTPLGGTAAQATATPIACGFSVTLPASLSGSGATFTAHVPVSTPPPAQALQSWVTSVNTETLKQISQLTNGVDASVFALQRLVGIEVTGPSFVTSGRFVVARFSVYPVWRGASGPDLAQPLWVSPSDGGRTLASSIGIDTTSSSTVTVSGGALQFASGTVNVPQPGTGTIVVTVAGLKPQSLHITASSTGS